MRWTAASEAPDAAAWPTVVLLLAVLLAWLPGLGGRFQFDDWNVVVRDPRVQDPGAWWAGMPGIRPLTKLSYALDHALGRRVGLAVDQRVAVFRVTSLLVHAVSAWLALALLRRWLSAAGLAAPALERAALLGALLFALHPVQTESVTYIAGRAGALAGALSLASCLVWLQGRDTGNRWLTRGASPLLFALALAAKETAVVLPLALLLLEHARRGPQQVSGTAARKSVTLRPAARAVSGIDPNTGPPRSPPLVADLWPHAVLVLGLAATVLLTAPYARLLAVSLATRLPLENLLVQSSAVLYLTGQWFWPVALNVDPDLPVRPAAGLAGWLPPLTVLAALTVAVFQWRRRRWLALGLLWYGLWLLPGNSLLARLDVANDRQLYLASLGPALMVARLLAPLLRTRGPALAVLATVVLGLGGATLLRNRVYRSEIAFWADAVAGSPRKARPANNLGYALALACQRAAAAREFARASALDPGYTRSRVNRRLLEADALPGATTAECPPGASGGAADAAD